MQEQRCDAPLPVVAAVNGRTICEFCPARRNGICEQFSKPVLAALKNLSCECTVRKGGFIAISGGPATFMYIVKRGEFKVERVLPDGRHQIIGFAGVGDIIGGPYANETFNCTFQALTDATICKSKRSDLEALGREHPQLIETLLSATYTELKHRNDQATLLGRKCADERLATFLLDHRNSSSTNGNGKFKSESASLAMSRSEIADYLGLTIETVSRTLSQFKRRGLVEVSHYKTINMIDAEGLMKIAGDDYAESFDARIFM